MWGGTPLVTHKTVDGKSVETWEYHFSTTDSICLVTFSQERVVVRNAVGNPAHIITRIRTIPIIIRLPIILPIHTTTPTDTPTAVTGGNTNQPSGKPRSKARSAHRAEGSACFREVPPCGTKAGVDGAWHRRSINKNEKTDLNSQRNDLGFLGKSLPLWTICDAE